MLPLFIIHRNIDTKALFTCKTNIRHEGLAKTQTSLLQLASLHLWKVRISRSFLPKLTR